MNYWNRAYLLLYIHLLRKSQNGQTVSYRTLKDDVFELESVYVLLEQIDSRVGLRISNIKWALPVGDEKEKLFDSLMEQSRDDQFIEHLCAEDISQQDLSILAHEYTEIAKVIFPLLNFEILLPKSSVNRAQKELKAYIESFTNGMLRGKFENTYTYSLHLEYAQGRLPFLLDKYGEYLTLDEPEFFPIFDLEYRFSEFVMSLEEKGYLKVIDISPYTYHSLPQARFMVQINSDYARKIRIQLPQSSGAVSLQTIRISSNEGICLGDKCYPMRGKKRPKIVKMLKDGKKELKIFVELLQQQEPLVISEIRQINKIFRKKLNVTEDLIIHIPTGGYDLNRKCFEIKFIEEM